jgi:hypothetical protein
MTKTIAAEIRADALRLIELARLYKDEKLAAELEKIALGMLRRAHELEKKQLF